jgi:putative AdoMet-dependent methyltransferase
MQNKLLYNDSGNYMDSNDSFPSLEFDDWAETYDLSISGNHFPFTGYWKLLEYIAMLADIKPGLRVLDLGTGTGNLALYFANLNCDLWCTDFSAVMLEKARQKIPAAHFVLNDLRLEMPTGFQFPFDRVVSAYVFHHFKLDQKVQILGKVIQLLAPAGRIIIGDIAFPNLKNLEIVKTRESNIWGDEFYWLADEAITALENLGLKVEYNQVSNCTGIFILQKQPDLLKGSHAITSH